MFKGRPPSLPQCIFGGRWLENCRKSFFSQDFEARQSFRVNLGFQRKKLFFTSNCVRAASICSPHGSWNFHSICCFSVSWGPCMTDRDLSGFTFQHVALNPKNANDAKKVVWHLLEASGRGNISTRKTTLLRILALNSWFEQNSPKP